MRNKEVIERFINHRGGMNSTQSLTASYKCLYSYFTCIAEWSEDGILFINRTKYSATTSRHLNMLLRKLNNYSTAIYMYDVPLGTISLQEFYKYG